MDPFCTATALLASFRRIRACKIANSMGPHGHRSRRACKIGNTLGSMGRHVHRSRRVATCCTMSRSTAAGVKLTATYKAPTAACGMAQTRRSCARGGHTNADPTPKSLILMSLLFPKSSSAPGGVMTTRCVSASGAAMTVAVVSIGHLTCCCLALHPAHTLGRQSSHRHTCVHLLASRQLSISGTKGHVKLLYGTHNTGTVCGTSRGMLSPEPNLSEQLYPVSVWPIRKQRQQVATYVCMCMYICIYVYF